MTELIERKKITIVGAGYVGMSIAVALAVKEDVLILESNKEKIDRINSCLLYTSPSPRDRQKSRMPSSA